MSRAVESPEEHHAHESLVPDIPLVHGVVHLARFAWRRKLLILSGVVAALGLATLYFMLMSPTYVSKAKVLVQFERPRSLPIPGADPRLSYFRDSVSTHQALLTGRPMVERAIERGDLTTLKTLAERVTEASDDSSSGAGTAVSRALRYATSFLPSSKPREFDPARIVMHGLEVTRETKSHMLEDPANAVFNVSFTCKNEEECTKILQAVIESYDSYLDESQLSDTDEVRALFVLWKDDIQGQLAEKQAKYRELLVEIQPLQWQSEQGVNLSEKRVAEILQQRLTLLVKLAKDGEHLDVLRKAREKGVSNEVLYGLVATWTENNSGQASERHRLFDLLLKEKELAKTYGPKHREIGALREQIEIAARQVFGPSVDIEDFRLMDPVEAYMQSLEQDVEVTRRLAESLQSLIEEEHTRAKEAHILNEDLAQLQADVDMTRGLQKEVLNQLQELDLVKESDVVEAQVLMPPSSGSLTPLSKPIVVFFFAGMLGMVAGGGLALLAEALDRRFRSPDELRRWLHLPVLGHIPYRRMRRADRRKAGRNKDACDPLLVTYHDPDSAHAEAYRGVRASLLYRVAADGARLIQIAGPHMGEGKSSLAANLAISMAQSEKHVLLVDADLRRPTLSRLFGLSNEAGLANVLSDGTDVDDVVQQTQTPGLHLLSSGPLPSSPGEQLTSPRFKQMLQHVAGKYDYVLIDSPALLAVADSSAMAAQVDGVLLILRNSRNAHSVAERVIERLEGVGARVLGVVIRGVKRRRAGGGYGYEGSLGSYEYANRYKSHRPPRGAEDSNRAGNRPTRVEPSSEDGA